MGSSVHSRKALPLLLRLSQSFTQAPVRLFGGQDLEVKKESANAEIDIET